MASNKLIPPWIASFVEHCLRFYIGEISDSGIEVDDYEGCLRFHTRQSSHQALIAEWGTGLLGHGAVLIDANNQIDGFISTEALNSSDSAPSISKSPQRHNVELLDLTLIVTCSDPSPDFRLSVNRCRIDWQGGEHKFTPKKKLKRKNQTIKVLLDRTLHKYGQSRQTSQFAADGAPPAKQALPEAEVNHLQASPLNENGSQIFSQYPASQPAFSEEPPNVGDSRFPSKASLLRRLTAFATPSLSGLLSSNKHVDVPKEPAVDVEGTQESLHHTASQSTHEAFTASQPGNEATEARIDVNSQSPHSPQNSGTVYRKIRSEAWSDIIEKPAELMSDSGEKIEGEHSEANSSSRKRRRATSNGSPVSNPGEEVTEQSIEGYPSKKKQKTNSASDDSLGFPGASTANAAERAGQSNETPMVRSTSATSPQKGRANPWRWPGAIPLRDVEIPKDQNKLLEEGDKIRWIPAAVGEPCPQGHVPPSLLQEWNNLVKRRHELAEEGKANSTQHVETSLQESHSSSASDSGSESEDEPLCPWSPSPVRDHPASGSAQLPPDSSPLKGKSSERLRLPQDEREIKSKQARPIQGPGRTNNLDQQEVVENDPSQLNSETLGTRGSPKVSHENSNAAAIVSSPQYNKNEQTPSKVSQMQNSDEQSSNAEVEEPASPVNDPKAYAEQPDIVHSDNESEGSDDSMMDTSVPIALGGSFPESSQNTQYEQAPESSGCSLPAANPGNVQVIETPVINNSRVPGAITMKESIPLDKASSSSQNNRSSSQSRVLNTYPAPGSHRQTRSSNEELHSSTHSNRSIQVKGTQPQPSNAEHSSQAATQNQTQSDFVLDSSGPGQRHHDTSQLESSKSAIEESSEQRRASLQPDTSQPNQPTQDSMAGFSSLDQSMGSQASPLARFKPAVNYNMSPSKVPYESPHVIPDSNQDALLTQSAELISRRQGYINNPVQFLEAHGVYERFRIAYPHYTGNFVHFIELCSKLQDIRSSGQLQQSFLWDDFIVMHLTQFPLYLEQYPCQETNPLGYEEYFIASHLHPVHKKRCLTLPAIDVAASQALPGELTSQDPHDQHHQHVPDQLATQREGIEESFTAGLVKQFSNFNAESFNNTSPTGLPPVDADDNAIESDTRQSSVEIKREHSEEPPELTSTQILPLSSYENSSVKEEPDLDHVTALGSCVDNTQDAGDTVMKDASDSSSESEADPDVSHYETASVELGDETFSSKTAAPPDENNVSEADEEEEEEEEEEENWFLALRRSRNSAATSSTPRWFHDPNTPFKFWAEADQNILSDRQRRGGAKILLDSKGVIRRPIHR